MLSLWQTSISYAFLALIRHLRDGPQRAQREKASSNTIVAPALCPSHQYNVYSQRNFTCRSTHFLRKMASNKLKVGQSDVWRCLWLFRWWLCRRHAPVRPWSQIEDIFGIKQPCVPLVTRPHLLCYACLCTLTLREIVLNSSLKINIWYN